MKRIFIILFIISPLFIFPQATPGYKMMLEDSPDTYTVYDIKNEADIYFANRDKGRGSGFKQYKRWENYSEPRFSPSGNMFNMSSALMNNYQAYINSLNFLTLPINYDPGYWTPVGPIGNWVDGGGWNGGIGQVISIEFSGSDCYIGTPAGGVWKATGPNWINWMPITDGLPSIGITTIAVNPSNSNNIFILTGDGEGGDTQSIGVLESTDGGLTWQATNLAWGIPTQVKATKLLMHPSNADIQFVSVRSPFSMRGIYKTTDGWNTWTKVLSSADAGETTKVYDMEFKPGNPSIIYASTDEDFYRSTSSGDSATFTKITSGLSTNPGTERVAIGVSPANSSYVYLLYGGTGCTTCGVVPVGSVAPCSSGNSPFFGFYRSTNSGASFTLRDSGCPNPLGYSNTGNDNIEQSSYDLCMAVSPTNINEVHIGGINCYVTTDGGANFAITSWWSNSGNTIGYTHADIHSLEYHPSNGNIYCGSDGGFYRSTDQGNTWDDRNVGLVNTQFYHIDLDANGSIVIGGTQDNGSNFIDLSTGVMTHELGADGFNCAIDPNNSNTWYMTTQSDLRKTTNGGSSFSTIDNSGSFWDLALVMHPTNSNILYVGVDSKLMRSGNAGSSFTDCVTGVTGGYIAATHGVSFDQRVYATTTGSVVMSPDNGSTWSNVTNNLNAASDHTDIAVNPDHSWDVWVTVSGYTAGDKVWYSNDKGANWTNISGSLPNVPVNCIVVDPDRTDHSVYIGTDVGIFYKDDSMSDWVPFFHGLPNTVVEDLEIENSEVVAGTHGRGIWRSNLYGNCFTNITLGNIGNPTWSSSYSNLPQYYAASDWIKSERTIYSSIGDSVRYQGGNYVELLPGFNAQAGANFKARIGQCSTSSTSSSPSNSNAPFMSLQDAIIYRCSGTLVPSK